MKLKTTIEFVFDEETLLAADSSKEFKSFGEFEDYCLDTTKEIIQEALKSNKIFNLMKVDKNFCIGQS